MPPSRAFLSAFLGLADTKADGGAAVVEAADGWFLAFLSILFSDVSLILIFFAAATDQLPDSDADSRVIPSQHPGHTGACPAAAVCACGGRPRVPPARRERW